jgi:alkylation response protein AidB-like acyl-CoA dehydrogenase
VNLELSPLQLELVQAVTRLLERECDTARVRAAEESGFDPALWRSLVELGIPAMGLAEQHGGIGADLLDVALVAECHGGFLAPVPLLETLAAYRALQRANSKASAEVLRRLVAAGAPMAIALDRSNAKGERLVAGGAAAVAVIGMEGGRLIVAEYAAVAPKVENLGAMPLAYRSLGEAKSCITIAEGPEAIEMHEALLLDWQVLTAAALAGLGRAGLQLGVNYAKERQAFGHPIGAFQAVAHRLAEAATRIEGARLISRAAAAAAHEEPDRFSVLSRMALAWCAEAAQQATADSLHVHGGYGFTLEYDIQLFVRRAKAWPLVLGNPEQRFAAIASAMANRPDRLRQWIFN